MDAVTRGRLEAMANDLAALATAEALFALDRLARRAESRAALIAACPRCGPALDRLRQGGLVASNWRDQANNPVYTLTPRGRDGWMSLRGWSR